MSDDEQEALSIKYNTARIVRLSSGRFALFSHFTNDDGLSLLGIGDIDDLALLIPSAEQCGWANDQRRDEEQLSIKMTSKDKLEARGLLQSLGLVKAQQIARRI